MPTIIASNEPKVAITQERLREVLAYDPATGIFRWKINIWRRPLAGKIAGWSVKASGHILIGIDRKKYFAHHLAWFWVHGTWADGMLDHRDRNPANNAIANLRPADKAQNAINAPLRADNSTGYRGVNKTRWGTYRAYIAINKKIIRLGTFQTPEEAAEVRWRTEQELYGEFACRDHRVPHHRKQLRG